MIKNLITLLLVLIFSSSCKIRKESGPTQERSKQLIKYICTIGSDTLRLVVNESNKSNEADIELYPEPYRKPILYLGSNIVYEEKSNKTFNLSVIPSFTFDNNVLIMLLERNAIGTDRYKVLDIEKDGNLRKVMYVYAQFLEDIDGDHIIEAGGYNMIERPCRECDSSYYNPIQVYEVTPQLILDSVFIIETTLEEYGCFLGFEFNDTILKIRN